MRRSRAFILSEILMTMMLQAGFILVLCTSFYMLTSFYSKTQQVLTARSHAERAISFVDDKIKNAGLGLWQCSNPREIRARLSYAQRLSTIDSGTNEKGYKWPVALSSFKDDINIIPKTSVAQNNGDVLTLVYAQRDLPSSNNEIVMTFRREDPFERLSNNSGKAKIRLIDVTDENQTLFKKNSEFTKDKYDNSDSKSIVKWGVAESIGVPFYINSIDYSDYGGVNIDMAFYGTNDNPLPDDITIPNAGEVMYLECMQIFVQDKNDGQGRQLAFREILKNGVDWSDKYNQEKNILEIYMTLDHDTNIFTLYVLAQGGYDASVNNPRPSAWPKEANPKGDDDDKAKTAWLAHDYSHYTVYVSRASWKLNNIPPNFDWSN